MREYVYVDDTDILSGLTPESLRGQIKTPQDILRWCVQNEPNLKQVTVTFIIALDKTLWINDRRSEHVLCANGEKVLSAGEMSFLIDGDTIEVTEVTNQSTGYCPEPESWPIVAKVLADIGLSAPETFTTEYVFRRCDKCDNINLVKDGWFVCGVCDADLSPTWNFQ